MWSKPPKMARSSLQPIGLCPKEIIEPLSSFDILKLLKTPSDARFEARKQMFKP
jgi:hypothetical protein